MQPCMRSQVLQAWLEMPALHQAYYPKQCVELVALRNQVMQVHRTGECTWLVPAFHRVSIAAVGPCVIHDELEMTRN